MVTIDCRAVSGSGRGILVAVVDSGWDRTLEEPRVLPGVGLVHSSDARRLNESDDDGDTNGHGTACSNLILDVVAQCNILPIRVFGRHLETSPESIVKAIRLATDRGARVINLSLTTNRHDVRQFLHQACERARRKGIVIIAAADPSSERAGYPAEFDSVLSVGSSVTTAPYDIEYHHGAPIEFTAMTAGRCVRGLRNNTAIVNGVSFAAPIVTGLVARMLSVDPTLNVDRIRRMLNDAAPGRPVNESDVVRSTTAGRRLRSPPILQDDNVF